LLVTAGVDWKWMSYLEITDFLDLFSLATYLLKNTALEQRFRYVAICK